MNVKNNRRKRESIEKIEKSLIDKLQSREINQISVTDICKDTGLNRSTFYANFEDIYDLADKLREKLESEFSMQFAVKEQRNPLTMFRHIYNNQLLYKTYFKLGYDEKHAVLEYDTEMAEKYYGGKNIKYHITFFKNGLNAIIKMWLEHGCPETPEEMVEKQLCYITGK